MATRKIRNKPARKTRRQTDDARAIEATLAGIAHDVRTPLTGILALAELLSASDLKPREREWAEAIKSGAEHLAALTTLIIDAAKADATGLTLRQSAFSPKKLAEQVGRALSARASAKGLTAEISIGNLPELALGDELRLRGAIENLADNAVKFTDLGTVSLQASAQPQRSKCRLVFAIADNGIGMSKSEMTRLFKPFAQASEAVARRYGGAGLGLVFVRRIAKAMGGDLKVKTSPGHGSTFMFSAVVEAIAAPAGRASQGARLAAGRPLAILCAEDNPYGRVVMNTILAELGHRVDFVETGEAAVNSVARGHYDVVLMDVTLGGEGFDGIEATRRIRALPGAAAQVPVIGISGRNQSGNEAAARAAGMNFYFVKPVSPGRLSEALAEATR